MSCFLSYLRRHVKTILLLFLFFAVFMLVFSLYHLPNEAVIYACVLCLAIGFVLFAVGYIRYARKHKALARISAFAADALAGLPKPDGMIERDYQDIVLTLKKSLDDARISAERARREAGDYYAMWAHQIKTPIAAMRLLLEQEDSDDHQALAAELFRVEQYVGMVLSYARLDGGSDYLIRECDVDEVIRRAARKFARLFILKKLSLDFRETHLTALTDEKWLQFVIEQLISNAVKYTPAGGVVIEREENAVVVRDSGIGIRAEDLPRVFDKGFTGFNGRGERKSTGIGLYLCRRVCQNLGHTLSLSSAPGKGTAARLDLTIDERVVE